MVNAPRPVRDIFKWIPSNSYNALIVVMHTVALQRNSLPLVTYNMSLRRIVHSILVYIGFWIFPNTSVQISTTEVSSIQLILDYGHLLILNISLLNIHILRYSDIESKYQQLSLLNIYLVQFLTFNTEAMVSKGNHTVSWIWRQFSSEVEMDTGVHLHKNKLVHTLLLHFGAEIKWRSANWMV